VAGSELAGEVEALGPGVRRWRVGDRVIAWGAGYAELAAVDARAAIALPDAIRWEGAGGLMVALLTMHDALVTHGGVRPGARVVVNAAASGIGVVGVRMAALLGAEVVFATSRSPAKLDVLRDFIGPMQCRLVTIDSRSGDLAAAVAEQSGGGADVIVDSVGAAALAENLAAAAIRGRIVQVGRLGGRTAQIDLDELARKRISLIGVSFRTRSADELAAVVDAARTDLGGSLDRILPRVDRIFPLDEAVEAQDQLARDEHVGKIVLVP
jgi:NADPH2:quinone reductase